MAYQVKVTIVDDAGAQVTGDGTYVFATVAEATAAFFAACDAASALETDDMELEPLP